MHSFHHCRTLQHTKCVHNKHCCHWLRQSAGSQFTARPKLRLVGCSVQSLSTQLVVAVLRDISDPRQSLVAALFYYLQVTHLKHTNTRLRPEHTKFLFSGQKKFEISGHFSGHQSHKNAFFLSFPAHITAEGLELRLK